ncbi:MAG: GNAT family N-acetyltransferase [Nocardioidaceae bacterium]
MSERTALPITIRLAEPAEFADIGELTARAYIGDGLLAEGSDYAARLRDAESRAEHAELWVAAHDERLLGTVTYCPPGSVYRDLATDGEAEFRMLAVDPTARRLGAARLLVRHCLDRTRQLGIGGLVLCSQPTMTNAHALYASLGFRRDPRLDWSPVDGVELWGFRTTV